MMIEIPSQGSKLYTLLIASISFSSPSRSRFHKSEFGSASSCPSKPTEVHELCVTKLMYYASLDRLADL